MFKDKANLQSIEWKQRKRLWFQIMANADELCQFARLGQTSKIQKCLQKHSE